MNPLPYSNPSAPPEFPPPCRERSGEPQGGGRHCSAEGPGSLAGYHACASSFCNTGTEYAYTGNVPLAECAAQCEAVNCTCFDYAPRSQGGHPYEHCRVAATSRPVDVVPSGLNYTAYTHLPPHPPTGGLATDGYCSGQFPYNVIVLDTLVVPATVPPGNYVLGFRWDCEKSAQVWAACADVTVRA